MTFKIAEQTSPKPFGFEPFSDLHKCDKRGSRYCVVAKAFRLRALVGLDPAFSISQEFSSSPKPFGFEPFSDYHLWRLEPQLTPCKSPKPFGFEPFSDFPCERKLVILQKSRQSLSASSPCRTYVDWSCISQYQKLSPEPFGIEPFSDDYGTRSDLFRVRLVARAFRLRALFGLLVRRGSGRTGWVVATAFRHRALFGLYKEEEPGFFRVKSPQPFGIEPFSDNGEVHHNYGVVSSPQPFGIEPFSDSGRYYSFILNILQECFGMGVFLFMNKR